MVSTPEMYQRLIGYVCMYVYAFLPKNETATIRPMCISRMGSRRSFLNSSALEGVITDSCKKIHAIVAQSRMHCIRNQLYNEDSLAHLRQYNLA